MLFNDFILTLGKITLFYINSRCLKIRNDGKCYANSKFSTKNRAIYLSTTYIFYLERYLTTVLKNISANNLSKTLLRKINSLTIRETCGWLILEQVQSRSAPLINFNYNEERPMTRLRELGLVLL